MNKNVEELRTILKEYSPNEPTYKGLIDIEVLKGVLDEVDRLNNIINKIYRELEDKQVRIMNGESFEDIDLVIYLKSKIRQLKSKINYEIKELKGGE